MNNNMTQIQQEILNFIKSFMEKRGYPPTLREMCDELGIKATTGIRAHLIALERKNYIIRRRYLSRGIELVNDPEEVPTDSDVRYIPIIGRSIVSKSMFDAENIEGMLAVDSSFISVNKAFALNIHDDRMSGAGIIDGDFVIAQRQHTAETGEIVVFIIGDEIIVRRYDEKGDKVLLIPENESYEIRSISRNSSDLQIAGKIIGIMRKY